MNLAHCVYMWANRRFEEDKGVHCELRQGSVPHIIVMPPLRSIARQLKQPAS